MNIHQTLNKSYELLKKSNIDSFRLDSEILLSKILDVDREYLLSNQNQKIQEENLRAHFALVRKREKKEPVAYLVGYKQFWKNNFLVNKSVLIPRPDTEFLVEESLKCLKKNKHYSILDIGTGSGCIIISLLLDRPKCNGSAVEVSKNAIKIAKTNAKLQQVHNRIKFINSDIDKLNHGKYDLVITNPPYIKSNEIKNLEEDIKFYEPKISLDGGSDGLREIKKVINKSKTLLKRKGKLILEFDHQQKKDVIKELKRNNFYINKVVKNYSYYDRLIIGTKL
tara:strand:+ start:5907 stop:6749 length:843 start_codon:yes stop_codon:yes gene_type:complete